MKTLILSLLALCTVATAGLSQEYFADFGQVPKAKKVLLSGYMIGASTTANTGTNVVKGSAWFTPPAGKDVTLGLRSGSTNSSSATVTWTLVPSNDGVNQDSLHSFVVGQTHSSDLTNSITTNMTSAVLGGAKFWMLKTTQNAHTASIWVSANVNWLD